MDIKKLQKIVVGALEDVKAQEILLFDTTHLTALFDCLAIASGTSNRQTKALAASVRDKVKEAGGEVISIEGEDTGEWVLVDLGDMIVHIMQPAIRAYYRLEEIWGDKPIKLTEPKRRTRARASDDVDEDSDVAVTTARKTAAKKTTAAKSATRAAASKTAAKTASKTASKSASKSAAKTAGKTAAKTAGKSTAAKSTASRSTAARSTAGKTATKTAAKSPARRSAGG